MPKFKRNPFFHVKEIESEMMKRFGVAVTIWHCYTARFLAQNMWWTLMQHYGNCRSYLLEQMRIDLRGYFILQAESDQAPNIVGYSMLKHGFM